jgi:hypothetical protein
MKGLINGVTKSRTGKGVPKTAEIDPEEGKAIEKAIDGEVDGETPQKEIKETYDPDTAVSTALTDNFAITDLRRGALHH